MQDSANIPWDASDGRHHKIQAQAQLVSSSLNIASQNFTRAFKHNFRFLLITLRA